jgi:hypothetical protein
MRRREGLKGFWLGEKKGEEDEARWGQEEEEMGMFFSFGGEDAKKQRRSRDCTRPDQDQCPFCLLIKSKSIMDQLPSFIFHPSTINHQQHGLDTQLTGQMLNQSVRVQRNFTLHDSGIC